MRYISPFQDLGIDLIGNLEKSDLNLAKKHLLAELELSSELTILRGSLELTKDDIIRQFDKLNTLTNWDFHRLVLVDTSLLEFVQNRKWGDKNALLKEAKYDNPAFVEFISPYFSESYKSLIIKNLANRNVHGLQSILDITPCLLTEQDHNNVWFSVDSFLNSWKENLDEITENVENGKEYNDNELMPYHGKSFMECLNLLPEHFTWFRDDYATSLYNLSANSWNKDKYYRALFLVREARLLDISEDTAAMIDERIKWFEAELTRINASDNSSGNFSKSSMWRLAFFIIVFISRLITANSHCNKNTHTVASSSEDSPRIELTTEATTRSKINDEYMEKAVKRALIKENSTSKKWDIQRFNILLNHVKKSEFSADDKFNNTLIVDKCMIELNDLKDSNKRTATLEEIKDLIIKFRVLQEQRGLL